MIIQRNCDKGISESWKRKQARIRGRGPPQDCIGIASKNFKGFRKFRADECPMLRKTARDAHELDIRAFWHIIKVAAAVKFVASFAPLPQFHQDSRPAVFPGLLKGYSIICEEGKRSGCRIKLHLIRSNSYMFGKSRYFSSLGGMAKLFASFRHLQNRQGLLTAQL